MGLPVDRPYSVKYEYKSIRMNLAFHWVEGSPMPTGTVITLDEPGTTDIRICTIITGIWFDFDQVVEESKEAARRWVDKQPN